MYPNPTIAFCNKGLSLNLFGNHGLANFINLGILVCMLASCATQSSRNGGAPNDLVPMYGEMEQNTNSEQMTADDKLIQETTKVFGSPERASVALANQGFTLYHKHDLDGAMRRFNQAWLLNPNNPEVYWGFASIRHTQGENCESMGLIEKALAFNTYLTGLYPDAGRIIVLCTVSKTQLDPDQKTINFEKAERLFDEASRKDVNKGYVYALWATAYYWKEQYEDAWTMVGQSQEHGGHIPDQFLSLLREKMPEPSMK